MYRSIAIVLAGLVGIIAPFFLADRIVNFYYMPQTSGLPIPPAASIAGFGAAVAIAAISFALALRAVRRDRSPITPEEAQEEELPE